MGRTVEPAGIRAPLLREEEAQNDGNESGNEHAERRETEGQIRVMPDGAGDEELEATREGECGDQEDDDTANATSSHDPPCRSSPARPARSSVTAKHPVGSAF